MPDNKPKNTPNSKSFLTAVMMEKSKFLSEDAFCLFLRERWVAVPG